MRRKGWIELIDWIEWESFAAGVILATTLFAGLLAIEVQSNETPSTPKDTIKVSSPTQVYSDYTPDPSDKNAYAFTHDSVNECHEISVWPAKQSFSSVFDKMMWYGAVHNYICGRQQMFVQVDEYEPRSEQ